MQISAINKILIISDSSSAAKGQKTFDKICCSHPSDLLVKAVMKLTVFKGFQAIGFSNEARENQKVITDYSETSIITWTHGFKLLVN